MYLTAINPRPIVFPRPVTQVELVLALPEDIKVLNENHKYVKRIGMIYWLRSDVTGKLSPLPRIITENTPSKELKDYLDRDMIYVSRSAFQY